MVVEDRLENGEERDQELDGLSEELAALNLGDLSVGGEQPGCRESDEDQADYESDGLDNECFPHSGLLNKIQPALGNDRRD